MEAGKLDRRITLRRATVTKSGFNTPISSWSDVATVWASRHDASDAERARAGQISALMVTRFRVRYSLAVAGIDPTWQLVCDGRTYQVTAVKELGRREGLELTATALADTL